MTFVNVGYDSTNYYVVGKGKSRLLVDVGWPGTLGKLLAEMKRKGVALSEIKYLLATHYHPDHAGLVQEVRGQGVQLLVMQGQLAFIPLLKQWMKPAMKYQDIDVRNATELKLAESRAFLAKLDIAGEIVSTPGHSDDSVTLVLDSGDAFTGDLQSVSRADEGDVEAVAASWEKLRAMRVRTIHPGHGPSRPIPTA